MLNLFKIFAPTPSRNNNSSESSISYLIQQAGDSAIVDETIQGPDKPGRVCFRGTCWPAICSRQVILQPSETVRVIGIDNITLLVEPIV